jgi:hypothetical protein
LGFVSSSLVLVSSFGLSFSSGLALSFDMSSFLGLESDLAFLGLESSDFSPNDGLICSE